MPRTKMQIVKDYENILPKIQTEFNNFTGKLQQLKGFTEELRSLKGLPPGLIEQLDLQKALQQQQQFIQTTSNLMKTINDTLKSIIQNLKA